MNFVIWLARVVRTRWTLRIAALLLLFAGPIGVAAFEMRNASAVASLGYVEVRPDAMTAPDASRDDSAASVAARYLSRRSPAVDRLLPAGAGGVRFFEHLGTAAGMAFSGAATIGLSTSADLGVWPEAIELHERAHLLHAFAPVIVGRLLSRLAPPAPDEYAATNAGEHFAEMAGSAWQIVASPDGMCVEGLPSARLPEAEARVPGTAGFVVWYLRHGVPTEAADRDALAAVADEAVAPHRAAWDALWAALDARRLPDGTFEPWRHPTIRAYLESRRFEARATGGWLGWIVDIGLLPSLAVLTLAGQ